MADFVITAAHCLPHLSAYATVTYTKERTYRKLLRRLGAPSQRAVSAELLFADPVSDLAILGSPDSQELYKEAIAFDQLISGPGFTVADIPANAWAPAQVLSLKGKWLKCEVSHNGGPLWMKSDVTVGGMSGSPIIDASGRAIGVVASGGLMSIHIRLMHSLPRWFPCQS